jgi:hypothetical protein
MDFNPLNPELNPICQLLALLGAHHILHFSGVMVKYIEMAGMASGNGNLLGFVEMVMNLLLLEHAGIS